MRRLSQSDLGNFIVESPTTPMQIAIAGVLAPGSLVDGEGLRVAEASARIGQRLSRTPALRQRIWWTRFGEGRPGWVDDDGFELGRHVVFPRTAPMTGAAFLQWCANDALRGLDHHRPLWRLSFVPHVDGRGVGVLIVLHHALADGLKGAALLGALLEAEGEVPTGQDAWCAAPPPGAWALVFENLVTRARNAAAAVLAIPSFLRRLWAARQPLMASFRQLRRAAPPTPLPRDIGPHRQLLQVRRALEPLREAGHRLGATLNDLVLAAVARGLRAWLLSRGFPPVTPLCASVPLGSTTTNATGVMLVPLPVDTDDSAARLSNVVKATRAAKQDVVPFDPAWLPGPLSRLWMRWAVRHGASFVNLFVTNVPGPPSALWLGDARLASVTPIAPLNAGVALSVAVFSYDGVLSVAVHLDGETPDPRPLVDGLAAELDVFVSKAE